MNSSPSRRRAWLATAGLALVLALVSGACSSMGTYAARVDGETISEDDLLTELRAIASNADYLASIESSQPVRGTGQGTFDAAFTATALTRQIYYSLIGDELVKRKLSVSPADLEAARKVIAEQVDGEEVLAKFPAEYQRELARRQAEIDLLALSASDVGTPDTAVRTYYDSHPEEFAAACASHILVADEAKANEVRGRLTAGEDFAAVAKVESQDPGSKDTGGEVGCDINRSSQLVAPFLDAVFAQPVGEVGPPVQTEFGFHLIKVTSRAAPSFDEASVAVREKLTALGQEKLRELLLAQVQASKIDVNPKYGTFDKTGESPGVVPPQGGPATTAAPALEPAP